MASLDQRLLAAHLADDKHMLVTLYCEAADRANSEQAAGFYLTHAHVFAMEINHPRALELRRRLVDQGREAPL